MKHYCAILILFVLAPVNLHAMTITDTLVCIASEESKLLLPYIQENIPLNLSVDDAENFTVDSSGLLDYFRPINLTSQDSYPNDCLYGFIHSIRPKLQVACRKMQKTKKKIDCSPEKITAAIQVLEAQVDKQAHAKQAVEDESRSIALDSFFPMETMPPQLEKKYRKKYRHLIKDVKSGCNFQGTGNHNDDNNFFYSSTFMNDYLLPFINSPQGKNCQQNVVELYNEKLTGLQQLCKNDNSSPQCTRFKQSVERTLKWMDGIKGELENYDFKNAICKLKDKSDSFDDINNLFNNVKNVLACRTLNVGEKRINKDFALRRSASNEYEVQLRLNFKPAKSQARYEKFVKNCFKKQNKLMQTPVTGNPGIPGNPRMKFVLSKDQSLPSHDITIMDSGFRSNSAEWESDIDCETIGHETLHLVGLNDCYEEFGDENDDWPIQNSPSLGQASQINSVSGSSSENGPNQLGHPGTDVNITDENETESNEESTSKEILPATNDVQSKYPCRNIGNEESIMNNQYTAFARAQTENENLLFADQMRLIIYPECRGGPPGMNNDRTYQCMESAYMSAEDCENHSIPAACTNGEVKL